MLPAADLRANIHSAAVFISVLHTINAPMSTTAVLTLPEEILELTDQISEEGKTIHELERMKKILDVEKSDIRAALEEAEVKLLFLSRYL